LLLLLPASLEHILVNGIIIIFAENNVEQLRDFKHADDRQGLIMLFVCLPA
jgi:hypothetical protein